jgi:succinate dehydrogenase hydrophobic anchor subunit
MTQRYSRSGSPRPTRKGSERTVWYVMRLTGLALFVLSLSHFLILHVLYDPKDQTAAFIANVRWSSLFWRANDWLFVIVVIVHAVLGIRIVVGDYLKGAPRTAVMMAFYLLGLVLFAFGTIVIVTLPRPTG